VTLQLSCGKVYYHCTEFVWQCFGIRDVTGGGFCEKMSKAVIEPMPAISKMDLALAKAEPISDGGSASGIT